MSNEIQLTSSLVWRVSPLANVTCTHGMESAAWWGMGHVYLTTLDLYFTCTLSDKQQGRKTGKYKEKAMFLKIQWQLVSQKRDQFLVLCMYHHIKSVLCCFFLQKTRGWFACSRSSGRSINHLIKHHWFSSLAHGSCRISHLTISLMALACHIALTNSVYLQAHQATLCTCCQLVGYYTKRAPLAKISAAGHPKHERILNYACSCRVGAGPVHRMATGCWTRMSNVGFQWLEKLTLKTAGAEHTSHVLDLEHNNTSAKTRTKWTNGRHMRQKRAVTTHPLFGAKC